MSFAEVMANGGPSMMLIGAFAPAFVVLALVAFGLAYKRVRVPAALWVLPMLAVVLVGLAGSLHGLDQAFTAVGEASLEVKPKLAGSGLALASYPTLLAAWIGAFGAGLTALALGLGSAAASGARIWKPRLAAPAMVVVAVVFVLIATRGFLPAAAAFLVGVGGMLANARVPNDPAGPEGVAMVGVRTATGLLTGVVGGFSGLAILATTMGGIGRVRSSATVLMRDRMTVQYLDSGLFHGQLSGVVIGLGGLALLVGLVSCRPGVRWGRALLDALLVAVSSAVLFAAATPVWFGAHSLFESSTPIEVLRRPLIGHAGIELATVAVASQLHPAPVLTFGASGVLFDDQPVTPDGPWPEGLKDVNVEIGRERLPNEVAPYIDLLAGAQVHWTVRSGGSLGAVQTTVFDTDQPDRRFGIANTEDGWLLLEKQTSKWVRVARSFDPDALPIDLHSSRFEFVDFWPGPLTVEEMLTRVSRWGGRNGGRQIALRVDPVPLFGTLSASRFRYRVSDLNNPEFPMAGIAQRLSTLELTLESCIPPKQAELPLDFEVSLKVGPKGKVDAVQLTTPDLDDPAWSQCVTDWFGDLDMPSPISGKPSSLVVPIQLRVR